MSEKPEEPMVRFMLPDGRTVTAAEYQEFVTQQHMTTEDFFASVRRLFILEASTEQLMTLRRLFRMLAAQEDAEAYLNYFEGTLDAALYARQNTDALVPVTDPDAVPDAAQFVISGTIGEHPWQASTAEGAEPDQCGFTTLLDGMEAPVTCDLPPGAVPHTKWTKNNPTTATP